MKEKLNCWTSASQETVRGIRGYSRVRGEKRRDEEPNKCHVMRIENVSDKAACGKCILS